MMAHAMLSLPATKGFEIGSGFDGCTMRGSVHNDPFVARPAAAGDGADAPAIMTSKNHAGGTLGGITFGADVYFRVAVKAVSTIGQAQPTSTFDGKQVVLEAKGATTRACCRARRRSSRGWRRSSSPTARCCSARASAARRRR